jgi:hypothetical protein
MSDLVYLAVLTLMLIGIMWALLRGLGGIFFHPNPHEGVLGPSILFVFNAFIVWPIKLALSLLRFLRRQFGFMAQTSYQQRHLRRRQRQRRSWLNRSAQRAARRTPRRQHVDYSLTGEDVDLDPDQQPGPYPEDYPRDRFDTLWQEHRRHGGEQQAS